MCYDVAYLTQKIETYEKRFNADYGDKPFAPIYHSNGFDHMEIPVITGRDPHLIQLFSWGLIPAWVKEPKQAVKLQNSTLNARDRTLFQKPAFKTAAHSQRCLVLVDGFYDHHWKGEKSYPYFIKLKSGAPFAFGGIWEMWRYQDMVRNTVSIITTDPNSMMAHIHNQPKASQTSRMPFIVPPDMESTWIADGMKSSEVLELIKPYPDSEMESYTVPRLRGKLYPGNKPEIMERYNYAELETTQGSLF